jgi:Asp/Glu/hydantoin racemase
VTPPRIHLIHALRESQAPIWDAFAAHWPEARAFNLLDDSLSVDRAAAGALTPEITDRFLTLGRYAHRAGADAILFTCSAFGPAIAAVKRDLPIPVMTPNEAAFAGALTKGRRLALLVTFAPSLAALREELESAAQAAGISLDLDAALVPDALSALQRGDAARHDTLIQEAIAEHVTRDAIILGQFSMARAARTAPPTPPVLTTPDAAVLKLRNLFRPQR